MDFLEKLCNLPHSDFDTTGCNNEQKQLYGAAKAFLRADEKTAEEILRNLHGSTQNIEIKGYVTDLLFPLLLWQDRFSDLAQFGIPRNDEEEQQINVYDTKNMTAVLSQIPKELPMPPAIADLPAVCAQINGVDVELLIDTGAMLTMVSESVAKKCDITISDKSVEAETPLENKITTQYATIDSFMVGNSEFKNKSCVVVPDSAYDTGDPEIPQINGKIGWEIIKNLRWTINYRDRRVCIEASKPEDKPQNMCCDFFPMVNVKINNKNIVMGLDIGAGATQFGKCMNRFFDVEKLARFTTETFATGTVEEISGAIIPCIEAYMSDIAFTINNAVLYPEREYSLAKTFVQSGVLGSDIAKDKALIIDYPNRNISISN
ncbi:MAG: retroviral-like aspartic protease family protein [Defluviitaleaceae bacterium]|nr:retroviral-like aspartic protease family protein [Defluviitaleaceae bacterium]